MNLINRIKQSAVYRSIFRLPDAVTERDRAAAHWPLGEPPSRGGSRRQPGTLVLLQADPTPVGGMRSALRRGASWTHDL